MPSTTILDAFLIEVGLDPTNFTKGQQKLEAQLRKLEGSAQKSSKNIEGSVGASLQKFYSALRNPVESSVVALDRIGAQARRSGSAIAAGAGIGATALAALGAAGLGAFAALKSVEGVLKSVVQNVSQAAALGRIAPLIGVSTQYASQFAQAAFVQQNVPFDTSTGFMYNLQQNIQQLEQFGTYGNVFEKLTRLGIGVGNQQNPVAIPQILSEIAGKVQGMRPEQAAAWLGQLGINDPGLINFFRQGPGAMQQAIAARSTTAITQKQAEAAQKLQQAYNAVEVAIDSLYRKIITDLSPALEQALNDFDAWIVDIQNDPETINKIEASIKTLSDTIKSAINDVESIYKVFADLDDILNNLAKADSISKILAQLSKLSGYFSIFGPGLGNTNNPELKQQPGDFLPETPGTLKHGGFSGTPKSTPLDLGWQWFKKNILGQTNTGDLQNQAIPIPGKDPVNTKHDDLGHSFWNWVNRRVFGSNTNNKGATEESLLPIFQDTANSAKKSSDSAQKLATTSDSIKDVITDVGQATSDSSKAIKESVDNQQTFFQEIKNWFETKLGISRGGTNSQSTTNNMPIVRSPTIPEQERIAKAMQFFQGKGLSFTQSAGIVGRLFAESKLDPNAINPKSGAYGIAQWLGDRKMAAVATQGDLDRQLQLIWNEFHNKESQSFKDILNSKTIPDVSNAMEEYERAGDPSFTAYSAKVGETLAGLHMLQHTKAVSSAHTHTNHYYDNDANIGAIHVAVNDKSGDIDGYSIGGAAAAEIRRQLTSQANVGLE